MRPILLEISGIGPFADKQIIDFSVMDVRALFLIHGPTGQGKSFIFDALCYALYADTPAGREGHLKSDFLPDGVEPWVRLRFALGDEIYEVRRALPYSRPKKNADGVTLVPEVQELSRMNPDGSPHRHLASKKSEVNRVLKELMGLDARQFRQVVMIPQGEFRKLLLSDSGDREVLLERLFDTRVYRDVQEVLKLKEDEAKQGEELRSLLRNQLVKEITDLWCDENLLVSQPEEAPFSERIEEAAARLRELAASRAQASRAAAEARDRAVSDCVRAERLHADHQQKANLEQTLSELEGQEAAMEHLKVRLESDRRALALKDRYAQLLDARLSGESSGSEYREAAAQLEAARVSRSEMEITNSQAAAWRERRELLWKIFNLLAGFRDEEKQRQILRNSRAAAEEKLEIARKTLEDWKLRHQDVQSRRSFLDREIENLKTRGSGEEKQRQIGVLESRLSLSVERDQLAGRIAAVTDLAEERLRRRDGAADELARLENLRTADIAGELAALLEENQPCPVCGSTLHPHPHPAGKGPLPNQIIEAEKVLEAAESELMESRSEQGSLQGQVQAISEKLAAGGDETGADAMSRRILELKGELSLENKLREEREHILTADLPALSQESESLTGEIGRYSEEVRSLSGRLAERETSWGTSLLQWPADESEGPPEPGDLPEYLGRLEAEQEDIENRIDALDRESRKVMEHFKSCETAEQVRKVHWVDSQAHLKRLEGDFARGISDAGFPDEVSLAAALEAAVNSGTDSAELQNWETRKSEALTLLADTVIKIDGRTDPDLRAYWASREHSIEVDARAAAELNHAESLLNRMNSLGTEYRKLQDENRDLETRNSLLRRLSEQVRGVSPPKISLNRYFLARRLEEVLVQATRRLTLLSRGRFVLKRRDEGRTAAAQAGLDLLVSDAWTGTERPVNTLSGGQLFMASLSLALGLADVVQARSGGVRLEALFIDEGFGTLDDDALQGVLAVLNDLRENRMVGVISHVPELKRQIADRIEVSAAGTGSKITMVHGD